MRTDEEIEEDVKRGKFSVLSTQGLDLTNITSCATFLMYFTDMNQFINFIHLENSIILV